MISELKGRIFFNPLIANFEIQDRFVAGNVVEKAEQIEEWLNAGKNVICDRYVSANQLHQGGKFQDEIKRKEFLELLDTMEHKIFQREKPGA